MGTRNPGNDENEGHAIVAYMQIRQIQHASRCQNKVASFMKTRNILRRIIRQLSVHSNLFFQKSFVLFRVVFSP